MLDVTYKVYCFAGDIARANGGQCNGCLVATREGTTGFLFANAGSDLPELSWIQSANNTAGYAS